MAEAAKAAAAAPPTGEVPRAIDLVLDSLAVRLTEGYEPAAPLLSRAIAAVATLDVGPPDVDRVLWITGNRAAGIIANEVWDYDAGRTLAERQVRVARGAGALVQLQFALNFLANNLVLAGDLPAAAALLEEDRLVSKMTGVPPVAYTGVLLEAFRGDEQRTSALVATIADTAAAHGQGRIVTFASYAAAVLHNGLGRHDRASSACAPVFQGDVLGYQSLALPELAEAASRTGSGALLEEARAWISAAPLGHPDRRAPRHRRPRSCPHERRGRC